MNRAAKFILLMGLVSLFGDVTYEGARSVTGPFLATFGVSAVLLGLVSGFGEFLGYAFRLLSGYLADRTNQYWLMTFIGYAMILSIPFLALAGSWEVAAVLLILERVGKALRSPARDAMLSFAAKEIGRGWGFGIHEAMDQIGAVAGPIILSAALLSYGYREGFALLTIPAILTLLVLSLAKIEYPTPQKFEVPKKESKTTRKFWLYTFFVFTSIMGFASFPIVAYHLKVNSVVSDALIPLLYAVAMGIDGLFALISGKGYDRIGFRILTLIPIFIPFTLLSFSDSLITVLAGVAIWGAVMGMQETVMRGAVADLTNVEKRGTAYGIFNAAYGLAWLVGGVVIGSLYDLSMSYLAAFVITVEIVAFLVVLKLQRIV